MVTPSFSCSGQKRESHPQLPFLLHAISNSSTNPVGSPPPSENPTTSHFSTALLWVQVTNYSCLDSCSSLLTGFPTSTLAFYRSFLTKQLEWSWMSDHITICLEPSNGSSLTMHNLNVTCYQSTPTPTSLLLFPLSYTIAAMVAGVFMFLEFTIFKAYSRSGAFALAVPSDWNTFPPDICLTHPPNFL